MLGVSKCAEIRNAGIVEIALLWLNISIGKAIYYIIFASTTDNPLKEDLTLSSLSLY